MEPIKIQCPHCKSVLSVKNPESLEGKMLTCPACKQQQPFANYPKVILRQPAPAEDDTHFNKEETLQEKKTSNRGHLEHAGVSYELHKGATVVGRKSPTSKAGIQIDLSDESPEIGNTMSRAHVQITMQQGQSGYLHYLQSLPDAKNDTLVNGQLLQKGDIIKLNDGDIITMGQVPVKFVIG